MKLLELYRSLLKVGGLSVNSDDLVSIQIGNSNIPKTVGGKRLALPSDKHLRNPNKEETVLFHPLLESSLRGESEILADFRKSVNINLNFVVKRVMLELIRIASSPDIHKNLSMDQAGFVDILKDCDDKTFINLNDILKKENVDIVHLYIKRSAVLKEKKYARACIVDFPIWEELNKEGEKNVIHGVTVRIKDRKMYKLLMQYMFPDSELTHSYSSPGIGDIAPSMESLMMSVGKLAGYVNDTLDLFENIITESKSLKIPSDWVEAFDNLNVYSKEIRFIPMQEGNQGEVINNNPTVSNPTTALSYTPTQASRPWERPVVPTVTTPVSYGNNTGKKPGSVSIRDIMGKVYPNQPQYNQPQQGRGHLPSWDPRNNTGGTHIQSGRSSLF